MKPPSSFTSDPKQQRATLVAGIIGLGQRSAANDPYVGPPVGHPGDPVGEALASAMRAALFDKNWDLVEQLQEHIDARAPRAKVLSLAEARNRKGSR